MLLENAQQFDLHIRRHVANLIQKYRSSVSQLKSADPAIGRAGESSLLMTKQFAFNETDGKRRAVYLEQRPIPALAVRVYGTLHLFLSGAGLSQTQHRRTRTL